MTEPPSCRDTRLWDLGDGKGRAARTAEIPLTGSRLGSGELIERGWWARWLPGRTRGVDGLEGDQARAVRPRELFEELGPSFVRIGQLLALHAGTLPEAYRDELTRPHDSVLLLYFSVMGQLLAEELGDRAPAGWLTSPMVGAVGIGLCLMQTAASLRRLRCEDCKAVWIFAAWWRLSETRRAADSEATCMCTLDSMS